MKSFSRFTALFCLFSLGAPIAASAESLSVLAFGDFGQGNDEQKDVADSMARWCANNPCDMATLLGDNFYPDGTTSVNDPLFREYFELPYAPLRFEFWAVLGNHDWHKGKSAAQSQVDYTQKSSRWRMPSRTWKMRKGPVEFFALDTTVYATEPSQLSNLRAQLKASSAPWKVVLGHHPLKSSGAHGNNTRMLSGLRDTLCATSGAIYVTGHDHDLEYLKDSCGLPMVVSGAAAENRGMSSKKKESRFFSDDLGYAILNFTDTKAELLFVNSQEQVLFRSALSH